MAAEKNTFPHYRKTDEPSISNTIKKKPYFSLRTFVKTERHLVPRVD